MSLTAKDIAEITRLLDESHFSELRLEDRRFQACGSAAAAGRAASSATRTSTVAAPAPEAAPAATSVTPPRRRPRHRGSRRPRPAARQFLLPPPAPAIRRSSQVGDTVSEDTAIGIIEVMKLMNPIRAGVAGTVVAMLAQDGKAVEEGQPLIRVKVG